METANESPISAARVKPLREREIASVAALLARAMNEDSAYRYLFPEPYARFTGLNDFFARNLRTHPVCMQPHHDRSERDLRHDDAKTPRRRTYLVAHDAAAWPDSVCDHTRP